MTAAVLLGAQAGLAGASYLTGFALTGGAAIGIESVLLWLGFVAVSKRLHDLGCGLKCIGSGIAATVLLAVAVAFGVMFLFGEDALLPGAPGYLAVAAAVFTPGLAATVWLHCAPGDKSVNRYGFPPGENGFSHPNAATGHAFAQIAAVN